MRTSRICELGVPARARRILSKSVYAVRSGYWHTGERCCPDFPDDNFRNHLKVYRFADQFCNGKAVLDVGCGTGYGTFHVAESATSAIGVDISRQAIRYARKHYVRANLQFLRMSAESMQFVDRSFDFIISTENFEHLRDQRANLREMARVLREDGALLLATPNPEMFLGTNNPYHTHEYTYEELLSVIEEFYGDCVIAENLLEPDTHEGRQMRAERKGRGAVGMNLSTNPLLWGKPIETTWASNTHSFMCFCRSPRRKY